MFNFLHAFFVSLTLRLMFIFTLGMLASCGNFLKPHKVSIQQGNVVTQEMIFKLKPGMNKRQVQYILGTPLIVDTFNDDQWHYIYSLRNPDGQTIRQRLSVDFVDGSLSQFTTDHAFMIASEVSAAIASQNELANSKDKTVTEDNPSAAAADAESSDKNL